MRMIAAAAAVLAMLPVSTAAAQTPDDAPHALQNVYACAEIREIMERAECYDAAVAQLRTAQSTGALVAVDRAHIDEIERDAFGFSVPSLPRLFSRRSGEAPNATNEIASAIVELQRCRGRLFIRLQNGQAWEQTDATDASQFRVGRDARVRRAAMGSFVLSAPPAPAAIRVRRIE